jgi:D-alanyl-D-alanine carboxypeptidase
VEKNQLSLIRSQTELEETVTAPVSRGQRLGTLKIFAGEQMLSSVPMVAEEAVERLSYWDIFLQILRRVCMVGENS